MGLLGAAWGCGRSGWVGEGRTGEDSVISPKLSPPKCTCQQGRGRYRVDSGDDQSSRNDFKGFGAPKNEGGTVLLNAESSDAKDSFWLDCRGYHDHPFTDMKIRTKRF